MEHEQYQSLQEKMDKSFYDALELVKPAAVLAGEAWITK